VSGILLGVRRVAAVALLAALGACGDDDQPTRTSNLVPADDAAPIVSVGEPSSGGSSTGVEPSPSKDPITSDPSVSGRPPQGGKGDAAPAISGTPPTVVRVGDTYDFVPDAYDSDGDKLNFAVSGKPAWASFNSKTGRLWGTPASTDAGTIVSVSISASDGKHTATLPFSLAVTGDSKVARYGHYFVARGIDGPDDVAMLCEQPGVSGVVWRRTWYEVEPAPGTYDFSSYDEILSAIAGSHNPQCQLWIFIEWKSFAGSRIKNPCPAYLQDRSAPIANGNGAAICFMWEPAVTQAYVAMMKAAAVKYDGNPRVEGVIFQETALSLTGSYSQDVADGGTYTAEAWRDALIEMVGQCGAAFKNSRCLSFLNFIRGGQKYLYDVSAALAALPNDRGCMSGPDVLPNNSSLYQNTASVYQVLVRHGGCRSNSVQNDSYEVPGCGMDCIFRFAVNGRFGSFDAAAPYSSGLCVNSYLFWNHRVPTSNTGLNWDDALPVIAAYPYGSGWTDRCEGGGGPL
jgi:hypothetical protein